jgi:hypothetical protein
LSPAIVAPTASRLIFCIAPGSPLALSITPVKSSTHRWLRLPPLTTVVLAAARGRLVLVAPSLVTLPGKVWLSPILPGAAWAPPIGGLPTLIPTPPLLPGQRLVTGTTIAARLRRGATLRGGIPSGFFPFVITSHHILFGPAPA